ncbi:hypothetical protein F4778DRAFT_767970 [Xylariomycetidae sp. FL2044]|nr:hypothetical protein F4778DRAFT_767970 [Xylariomycetidae sp. FL2044]
MSNITTILPTRETLSSLVSTFTSASASPGPGSGSWKQYIIPAAVTYVAVCRVLRYRCEERMKREFRYDGTRESLRGMTNDQAQKIIKTLAAYEFPQFHLLALEFGLFKTYGVESISRLLLATRNLTDPIKSLKRYEDTAALIGEFMINPPTSPRALEALARMNFLHSKYVAEGSISNADLLYTLSVFVTEPPRFARLYEWRALNDLEVCAYGVFWKSVGDAMGIRYDGLLPRAGGNGDGGGWKDGLEFAEDIAAWAKDYEVAQMRPSVTANKPARALLPIITYWVPWFVRGFAEQIVCVLMGDRAREAFMLPEPDILAGAVVYPALALRRFVVRWLMPPRLREVKRLRDPDPATGRMHSNFAYGNHPYYIEPTFWNRWGPSAWLVRLYGGVLPGDEPEEYMPQGYRFEDLGPKNRMGLGREQMDGDVKRMAASARGGCPFG